MSAKEYTRLGRKFMKRLSLDEWIPKTTFHVGTEDGYVGWTDWHPEERTCEVHIKRGLNGTKAVLTLIHELLHVRLEAHKGPPQGRYDRSYEFALNKISEELYMLWLPDAVTKGL